MNFRDFMNIFDLRNMPASPDAPQSQHTVTYAPNTTDWEPNKQQSNHALTPLVQAMKELDPFLLQSGKTTFSGTPDYTSPEQARGSGKDDDRVTNLYYTLKHTRPQMAMAFKPVAIAFKQFETDFLTICDKLNMPLEWHENQHLANKLDRMTIGNIQKGIQAFGAAIQQIPPDAIQPAQQIWQKMQQSFQRFAQAFNAVQPQLMQQLQTQDNSAW